MELAKTFIAIQMAPCVIEYISVQYFPSLENSNIRHVCFLYLVSLSNPPKFGFYKSFWIYDIDSI